MEVQHPGIDAIRIEKSFRERERLLRGAFDRFDRSRGIGNLVQLLAKDFRESHDGGQQLMS